MTIERSDRERSELTPSKFPPRVWLEHIGLEQFGRVVAHGTPGLDEFEYCSLEEHLAILARERENVRYLIQALKSCDVGLKAAKRTLIERGDNTAKDMNDDIAVEALYKYQELTEGES